MILVIGELLIDMMTTELVNNLSETKSLQLKVGGSAANFAIFCKKQHTPVTLIAAVGKDGFGKIIMNDLAYKDIDIDNIATLTYHQTSIIVVAKSHSTPDFIPYRSADCNIGPIPENLLAQSDIVHSTAFALSKDPAQHNILAAFAAANAAGKKISIDWNYALKIWGADNNALQIFEKIIAMQPLLKVSMDDVERFLGTGNDIENAKKMLEKYDTAITCLTCGAAGVWYRTKNDGWRHKANLPTNVIDVTGAGDAFWSGFVTAYFNNHPTDICIDNALFAAKQRLEQQM